MTRDEVGPLASVLDSLGVAAKVGGDEKNLCLIIGETWYSDKREVLSLIDRNIQGLLKIADASKVFLGEQFRLEGQEHHQLRLQQALNSEEFNMDVIKNDSIRRN